VRETQNGEVGRGNSERGSRNVELWGLTLFLAWRSARRETRKSERKTRNRHPERTGQCKKQGLTPGSAERGSRNAELWGLTLFLAWRPARRETRKSERKTRNRHPERTGQCKKQGLTPGSAERGSRNVERRRGREAKGRGGEGARGREKEVTLHTSPAGQGTTSIFRRFSRSAFRECGVWPGAPDTRLCGSAEKGEAKQ
jgi:hypothetical protein